MDLDLLMFVDAVGTELEGEAFAVRYFTTV